MTVIEAQCHLLPNEDCEVGSTLAKVFSQEGIVVRLASKVSRVASLASGLVQLQLDDGSTMSAHQLLVASGRRPVTAALDAEAGGITLDRSGFIIVNDHLATTARGVFAVGDVTGRLPYTHAADEMGRLAVANAFSPFARRRFRTSSIPWVTFTRPEIARVGMNEPQAADVGGRVAYVPICEVDRAIAADRTIGFVKLLAGPRRFAGSIGGGNCWVRPSWPNVVAK